ncbi:sulfite exporter TauE/SafE family protein [Frankia sp. AgB1.9]|uniref:sulfite exporter TauE/SafE family protein n=1 Tax=unclassified Frankia TaxID=2632575 RepID=UPI0019332DBA|nr:MULTISPECIES: sulfite exporter TauE/SafE family protein [unclassified Frankia]MBL7491523.1 sulfite exporter TauE/SafE family protein [Frankia sp. AgW1.1]MBL7552496.1 sulfite exporter TauE/SafE family protein [Frankia sp. AgB1.9]MBL7622111.1 sulfite exporter TauE/SafE family protein [Frankia sp. AgB1.8]
MVTIVFGFVAGLVLATVTAPVGVSGAVFLLPVQLDLLSVPSPAVTPTNLIYNVIATPGSLLRYHQQKQLGGALTRRLVAGTLPGVVLGAIVRVRYAPGAALFRLLLACLLLPLGIWLCARTLRTPRQHDPSHPGTRAVTLVALAVGFVGGVYGIGGGSILGPILVGRGMPVATVAPATLASTFVTSIAGAATYGVLALTTPGNIAPHWALGLACGAGGLTGGYLGARLQTRLPNTALRLVLGGLAIALAALYLVEAA